MKTPWAIAHRGFSANYPENTIAAFDAALATPIQAMELDLQWTRDQVVIAYHDRSLHRLGVGRAAIRNRNWAELVNLDAGRWFGSQFEGLQLLKLDEVLQRYERRTWLLLEIKRRELGNQKRLQGLMEAVIKVVRTHDLESQVAILCFDNHLLRYGRSLNKRIRFVLNQERPELLKDDGHLAAYSVRARAMNPRFVLGAHARGKPVMAFTVNQAPMLSRLVEMGVDGIMSDNPAWLSQALRVIV